MNPSSLRIGDYEYIKPVVKSASKWKIIKEKSTVMPKIAYTYNGEIIVESITKDLLDNFTL